MSPQQEKHSYNFTDNILVVRWEGCSGSWTGLIWRAVVNTAMSLQVPENAENILLANRHLDSLPH